MASLILIFVAYGVSLLLMTAFVIGTVSFFRRQ